MTTTESWSRADARDMNLYQFFADITGHKFYDNTNFSFQGKTYQDTIDYTYDYNGRYYAFGVLGSGFAVNSKGVLTGGTVNGTVSWYWDTATSKWYYDAFNKDYAIAATAFVAPYLTVSRGDDHASFRQVLSGNDRRVYHDYNYYGYAGAGNDTLTGNSGSDVFLFRAHDGLDHITDFQDGMDRVKVLLAAGTDLNLKLKYVGGDVVATFLDVTLVFDDVQPGSITAADFTTLFI